MTLALFAINILKPPCGTETPKRASWPQLAVELEPEVVLEEAVLGVATHGQLMPRQPETQRRNSSRHRPHSKDSSSLELIFLYCASWQIRLTCNSLLHPDAGTRSTLRASGARQDGFWEAQP